MAAGHTQKVAKKKKGLFLQCIGSYLQPGLRGAVTLLNAEKTTELHDSTSRLKQISKHKAVRHNTWAECSSSTGWLCHTWQMFVRRRQNKLWGLFSVDSAVIKDCWDPESSLYLQKMLNTIRDNSEKRGKATLSSDCCPEHLGLLRQYSLNHFNAGLTHLIYQTNR